MVGVAGVVVVASVAGMAGVVGVVGVADATAFFYVDSEVVLLLSRLKRL